MIYLDEGILNDYIIYFIWMGVSVCEWIFISRVSDIFVEMNVETNSDILSNKHYRVSCTA